MGLVGNNVLIQGDFHVVNDFALPKQMSLIFGPKVFHKLIRKHMVQRPVVDNLVCILCGECWKYCPAKAITPRKKMIEIDYNQCIRCYCCIEVCPNGAIHSAETLPGKVMHKLSRFV